MKQFREVFIRTAGASILAMVLAIGLSGLLTWLYLVLGAQTDPILAALSLVPFLWKTPLTGSVWLLIVFSPVYSSFYRNDVASWKLALGLSAPLALLLALLDSSLFLQGFACGMAPGIYAHWCFARPEGV